MPENMLVVDDQPDVREALRLLLKGAGYAIDTAESPSEALAAAAYRDHDLIVVDMNYTWDTTSGDEGLRLLDGLRRQRPDVPIIAMTGWSTVELAVEAMHRGACDFIPKPWDNKHFLSVVRKHLRGDGDARRPLAAELARARDVQRRLLPESRFHAYGLNCEFAATFAGEIGGDVYDFIEVDERTAALTLGDVCGNGIGAALLGATLQATIRAQRELALHPAKLMDRVNRLFFESTRPEHFATLFFAAFDSTTRRLRYVNCGHPAPVLLRAGGGRERLECSATILGAFKDHGFEERDVELTAGDRLVLFSDGFSEAALDEDGDAWAVEMIVARAKTGAAGLAGWLAAAAATKRTEPDDITVVDVRVL